MQSYKKPTFIIGMLVILFSSCETREAPETKNDTARMEKSFNPEEPEWLKPYHRTHTVIFASEKGESDTIIFYKVVADHDTVHDFEQGYAGYYYLTVPYDFTKGSYHQFAIMGDGKTRYTSDIFKMVSSTSGYKSQEIEFIGILFDWPEIKNIQKVDDRTYFFESSKATYSGMNVEKGIKDFTFNTSTGVISYTDQRGIKWTRK